MASKRLGDSVVDEATIRAWLTADVQAAGSLRAFGRKHGFSPAYLSDVLRGLRHVGTRLPKLYGYRAERRFIQEFKFVRKRAAGGEG